MSLLSPPSSPALNCRSPGLPAHLALFRQLPSYRLCFPLRPTSMPTKVLKVSPPPGVLFFRRTERRSAEYWSSSKSEVSFIDSNAARCPRQRHSIAALGRLADWQTEWPDWAYLLALHGRSTSIQSFPSCIRLAVQESSSGTRGAGEGGKAYSGFQMMVGLVGVRMSTTARGTVEGEVDIRVGWRVRR